MGFFGIISDDLTGAMDAGVQMLEKGCVRVALSVEDLKSIIDGADFIVVNTQTRNVCGEEAYYRTKLITEQLVNNGCQAVYKKIDSTLRGHIGFEVKAILDCNVFDCVIIAPALPFNNRVTINGVHFVNGVRFSDTEFAKDPFSPINSSVISEIVKKEYNVQMGLVNLGLVRKGSIAVFEEVSKLVENGIKVIIADAVEENDLIIIASGLRLFKGNKVLCGSAGLFKYFDIVYDIGNSNEKLDEGPFFAVDNKLDDKPILVISGSPAFMSKKQIEYAVKLREDIRVISHNVVSQDHKTAIAAQKSVADQVMSAIEEGYSVVVDAAGQSKEDILRDFKDNRERLNFISLLIHEFVSEIASRVVSSRMVGGLVLFGGDTAYAVIKRLGAKGIEIVGQIEPYIPYGKLIGGEFSGLPVVTKAGGFGNENSLVNILNRFCIRGDKR